MSGTRVRPAPMRLRRRRRLPLRVLRRLPRPGPRALVVLLAVLALAAGGWVWLRNSSLVAVKRVTIVGVSGRDAQQIRSALLSAAHNMTTLNVKVAALRTAIEPFPVVKHLHVTTHFPHQMRIIVVEQVPVALISTAGIQEAVSADGTLLHGASIPGALPTIALSLAPGGARVTGTTLSVVRLLAAAPYQLLAKVSQASVSGSAGLVAQVRNGPKLYFGPGSDLSAKWAAAAAVLANPGSAGADYIDVTVPSRAAAGAGSDSASSAHSTSSLDGVPGSADQSQSPASTGPAVGG